MSHQTKYHYTLATLASFLAGMAAAEQYWALLAINLGLLYLNLRRAGGFK